MQVTSLEGLLVQFINTVFQTNNILSGLLIIIVVWGGRWFGRVAWVDVVAYFKSKEEIAERRFQIEQASDAENDKRRQESDRLLLETLMGLSGEQRAMVAVLETQRVLLINILRSMNGSGKAIERAMEEASAAAQDSRGRR